MRLILLVVWLIFCCVQNIEAQDVSKYKSHELYPYLSRSKQILERLETSIQSDSLSSDPFIKMDAEAERNEHQFLTSCLKDELKIIDDNFNISWHQINVLSFGADPTGVADSRGAFIAAIASAKNYGTGAEIWIPNGTYSLNGSCELFDMKNMKFTGDNAVFIFNSVSAGLDVRGCRNFEITGVSIDYKQLPWTQGTLTAINGNDVFVKFDNGYAELQNWHNASLRFYDPATKLFIHSAYRWSYNKTNASKQGNGSWKLPSLNAIDGRTALNQIPIGSKVVILSRQGEDAYHYGLQFPSEWTYNAINLIGCEYVTIRNVNIYSAWEADVAAHGTNSGIRYINLHIEPKPGTDRLVCGNSDTHVHYTGRKGDFIYNSKISGGSDDGCDYASLMSNVNAWQTDHSFLISGSLDINWTPVRKGDGVWIINPQGGPYRFFAKITNVENASGQTLVTLDRPVPSDVRSLSGNMALGVNSKFDGNILLNNEWSNGSANGIYLYSSNTVVENNTISHFFYSASLFRMTTPPFWTAGGSTRNLFYTGNTVNNKSILVTSSEVPSPSPNQCIFRHLTIANNNFTGSDPISLSYVSNSVISDNIYNISGGTNVSITNSCGDIIQNNGFLVSQSSVDYKAIPSRAFDGNTSGDFQNNSVIHTLTEANPWWTLDRLSSKPISQLKIYNRTDCCSQRLHDFYVFVSDNPFISTDPTEIVNSPGVFSYYYPGIAGNSVTLDVNRSGRYIRVQVPGVNEVLSLAEVEITSGQTATSRAYSGKWNFDFSPEGWKLINGLSGSLTSNIYNLNVTSADPYMFSPDNLNLNAASNNLISLGLKNATSSNQAELYWITNLDGNYDEVKHKVFPITPNDGAIKEYLIDLSSLSSWKGIIRQIRIDPSMSSSGKVDLDYVVVKSNGVITGLTSENIQGVSVYPNPAKEKLYLRFDEASDIRSLKIVSLSGVEIYSRESITSSNLEIDLEQNLSPGIYTVSIVKTSGVYKSKLIIR